jgi:septum formation protein
LSFHPTCGNKHITPTTLLREKVTKAFMLESSFNMAHCALILASGSPRRRELLGLFDIPFAVQPADIDETQNPGETPRDYVWRLAREKGQAIAQASNLPVLSADTIVEFEGQVWGKPLDRQDAERILGILRGRMHRVYTAISLIDYSTGLGLERLVESDVFMRDYSKSELQTYLDSGNWYDKAGGYAIQDSQFQPCEAYGGSYTNIMGLPVHAVTEMLAQAGFEIREDLLTHIEDSLGITCAQMTKATYENNA